MKKLLAVALGLALIAGLAFACFGTGSDGREGVAYGDYFYALRPDGTAEITGYRGQAEELALPAVLNGHAVAAIGDGAFYHCDRLTAVAIPEGVVFIGSGAFSYCPALERVVIPASVTAVGVNPFHASAALKEIILPENHPALALAGGALIGRADRRLICLPCANPAEAFTVPEGVEIIGDGACSHCVHLKAVTIPEGVSFIGQNAFSFCSKLAEATIPRGVAVIGDSAFAWCASLADLVLPDSVSAIGDYAFAWCASLVELTLPEALAAIAENAFDGSGQLSLSVSQGSFAADYCARHNLTFTCWDAPEAPAL